jgi:hypothetical protein
MISHPLPDDRGETDTVGARGVKAVGEADELWSRTSRS